MARKDMVGMAGLMGSAVEALAATQALGLAALKAEMDALALVLPGHETPDAADEARRAAEEAAVEAGFDNLPV